MFAKTKSIKSDKLKVAEVILKKTMYFMRFYCISIGKTFVKSLKSIKVTKKNDTAHIC